LQVDEASQKIEWLNIRVAKRTSYEFRWVHFTKCRPWGRSRMYSRRATGIPKIAQPRSKLTKPSIWWVQTTRPGRMLKMGSKKPAGKRKNITEASDTPILHTYSAPVAHLRWKDPREPVDQCRWDEMKPGSWDGQNRRREEEERNFIEDQMEDQT
jgi:hypothetical protein